ncbi:MAG: DUF4184 family protein [Candidatus Asgardarchaeia archaeon]
MPAWPSHPGILIINRLGKKKKFDGLCIVVGSLVPDLEFLPSIIYSLIKDKNLESLFHTHMQGFFHSIFGLTVTVPLTLMIAYLIQPHLRKMLIKSKIANIFNFRNLSDNNRLCCWSVKTSLVSATIGVSSAIIFDFLSHDETRILYPLIPSVKNPLTYLGISSFSVWVLLSIVLFVMLLLALYRYPLGEP